MNRLLDKYRAERSLPNAMKLAAYDRKHPMAACMLSTADADLLREAIRYVNTAIVWRAAQ